MRDMEAVYCLRAFSTAHYIITHGEMARDKVEGQQGKVPFQFWTRKGGATPTFD